MDWKREYNRWVEYPDLEGDTKRQLLTLKSNKSQLEDSFYTYLEFGTGGMRGKIGPGTNRMNIYTVRKAAKGLANYIESYGDEAKKQGVVIAYDSRFKSYEFAMEAARTLGNQGVQTYVFESLRTTPELSFAVRYLHAYSGIVITASHNPAEYNGFKVYGSDGAQYSSEEAQQIVEQVNRIENELEILVGEITELEQQGLLKMIGNKVDQAYLNKLKTITIDPETMEKVADQLRIVYTPLHATGNLPVRRGLSSAGFKHVQVVKEQELPDVSFPTVKFPNPEEPSAFALAIEYGKSYNADILLATDPDADRVGVAVKDGEEYTLLTGNQTGALLLHYIISKKKERNEVPINSIVLKTIVTSELGRSIAEAYGIETVDVLTGFKYISAKIKEFENKGNHTFLFGYEESYGYLYGDFVRDKDAVQVCLLISEAAAYYKSLNKNLLDVLEILYEEYGYYREGLESLTLEGKAGVEQIQTILTEFRKNTPTDINGKKVMIKEDYLEGVRTYMETGELENINLPKSDVLKYKLENGTWFCLRPSGTEPKIKFYFAVKENSDEESSKALTSLKNIVMEKVRNCL